MDRKTHPITELQQRVIDAGITLISSNGDSTMVPIASEPYSLSRDVYNDITTKAELLGRFTLDAALDNDIIEAAANKCLSDKVCETLWRVVLKKRSILGNDYAAALQASTAILQRADFYVVDQVPRLVEINTVSVALLSMSAQFAEIQAKQGHSGVVQTNTLALHSSLSHIAVANGTVPSVWVMIVSEEEPMINDQLGILQGYNSYCKAHGIPSIMIRKTCRELVGAVSIQGGNLVLPHEDTVLGIVGVYWRTGYAPEHCTPEYERLRVLLETHSLVSIPTAEAQLAGVKAVQNMIPTLVADSRYEYLNRVVPVLSKIIDTPHEVSAWLSSSQDTSEMVLKSVAEGGGNCVFGDDIPATWNGLLRTGPEVVQTHFLMERLMPDSQGPVLFIYPTEAVEVEKADAEIGIYSFCRLCQLDGSPFKPLGALVRMKASGMGEGGILHGQGVLTCLRVK